MKTILSCGTAALIAVGLAGPAFAQATNLTGVERLDDRIDDIREDVNDDLDDADDPLRFNLNGVQQGLRGSVALRGTGTDGNTDTADLSAGGRLTYGVGDYSHSFGVAAEYGKSNGVTDKERVFATYEGLRAFSPRFYGFGTGRFEYDSFSTVERDAFLGVGAGVRIIAEPDHAWRVQAAPGVRYTDLQDGTDETEAAGILSSRYYLGLSDQISLTNDTDVLTSDQNTEVVNDFGVNYRVSNNVSMRVSYRTDYDSDPLPGFESTDNTIGIAAIVGF